MASFPYRRLTLIDTLLIALLLGAAACSFPFVYSHQPATVVVYRDNRVIAEYAADSDRRFTVQGREGPVVVAIEHGAVRIAASSCRKHLCMAMGPISRHGAQIVCAPNHILIQIRPRGSKDIVPDAVTP